MQKQPDAPEIAADRVPTIRGKQRLQTLNHLDHRTRASRRACQLIVTFERALGDRLTAARRPMVERAAMLCVIAEDAQARRLAGDPMITINDIVRADGAARRAIRELGIREPETKPAVPTLADHLAARAAERAGAPSEPPP